MTKRPERGNTGGMNNYTMWIIVLLFVILLLVILFGTGVLG